MLDLASGRSTYEIFKSKHDEVAHMVSVPDGQETQHGCLRNVSVTDPDTALVNVSSDPLNQ